MSVQCVSILTAPFEVASPFREVPLGATFSNGVRNRSLIVSR